jgi:DNA-binding transcriptional LysR family regulator
VALTGAGQALLPEARATLAAAQAAQDAVAQARAGLRGTLTVGTLTSTGGVDLPALLGRFHDSHPRVAVHLRQSAAGSAGLARQVVAGELDLALVGLPGQPPTGLRLHPLSEPLVLICAGRHPLAGPRTVRLADLADETFVGFPPGWGNRTVSDRAFAAAGLDRQVPFEVADYGSAAALVRYGLGVAFMPVSAARGFPGLHLVELDGHRLTWRLSVATPTTRRLSVAARAFLAELIPAND